MSETVVPRQVLQPALSTIAREIEELPLSSLQLVAGLFSLQEDVPEWLSSFIMNCIGKRIDVKVVTPAAEAIMRIRAFSQYVELPFAVHEIRKQHQLLKSLKLDAQIYVAVGFINRLSDHLFEMSRAASLNGTGALSVKQR